MRRLVALILAAASIFSLASCDRSYDEGEVLSVARELIESAVVLNEIFYGEGIPYNDSESTANGAYREASSYYLQDLGAETLDDIKQMARRVFSEKYCEQIFSTVMQALTDGDYIIRMARYYQATDAVSGEPTYIMVYTQSEPLLTDEMDYDYESLCCEGSRGERVYVKIDVTVKDSESGEYHKISRSIALIEEKDGWRIDSPSYAQYNPELSEYEEIQNNK